MKIIIFLLLILLFSASIINALDKETIIVCGGDSETVVGCVTGDQETSNPFQFIRKAVSEITPLSIAEVEKVPITILIFIIFLFILIIFLIFFFFFIYKKRRKK